ncbi:MAG: hypothetical protein JSU66_16000 [Deltaproteobacteria bacterium]|nr:MAG: hypothetical protein JSU66_16000 [Deltaproteobacteria bacterium]
MRLSKEFDVEAERDDAVERTLKDETLIALFPDTETEIVDKKGDRKTTRTRYRALGREGVATFHFDFLMDGNVRFEKVCDGRIWRELRGAVTFEESGRRTRVRIEMEGNTKPFVPEFTIRQPMNEQLDQMATALRERLERGAA